jgi:sporulation integral membrane protein YtvI
MNTVNKRRDFIINVFYFALLIGLFYLAFKYAFGVLLPFIAAVFIAVMLQKPLKAVTKKMKKGKGIIASVMVVFCFVVVGSIVVLLFMRLFAELKSFFDYIMLKLENTPLFIAQVTGWIETKLTILPESIRTGAAGYVETLLNNVLGTAVEDAEAAVETKSSMDLSWLASPIGAVWGTAKQIPMIAVGILVSIVSCCFMTADYASLKETVLSLAGEKNSVKLIATKRILFSTLGKMAKAYTVLIMITFSEMLIGLSLLKLFGLYKGGYIFAIALITAVVDIFPVLGTGTILIPWGIWSLVTGNIGFGIGVIVLYIIITVIRQAIEPKIVADQLGLPPFVTIMAMYVGTQIFGFIGLFLMPISIMILKALSDEGIISIFKKTDVSVAQLNAEVEEELHRHTEQE